MSVAKYQVFLKTVECGSFTAAARELNFTQSGASWSSGPPTCGDWRQVW